MSAKPNVIIFLLDDMGYGDISAFNEKCVFETPNFDEMCENGCAPVANFKELAQAGHNPSYIFRGHKADIYEGRHRIPLIVSWPEKIKPGGRCNHLVGLSDFMATMADYFETKLPENVAEDSVSNLPLWFDPDSDEVRNDVVHQSIDGSLVIRKGSFKLEMCPGSVGWSYPVHGEEDETMPKFQLYNLDDDIKETINVIEKYPKILNELKKLLVKYVREGRSTPGVPQKNNGAEIWETVKWLEEE